MPVLQFPTDRTVGVLEWAGSWSDDTGPVLARGPVAVPDGVAVSLEVEEIGRARRSPEGGSWHLEGSGDGNDFRFLADLPRDSIWSLALEHGDEDTFDAVGHLAPGLRRLYLPSSEFTDDVLPTVATLTGLTWLQTFGNEFTDAGVQQLAALTDLESLYLEEETLTAAAFAFADRLPRLRRLGLQDVTISPAEVERLRARLPGVDVG